MIIWDMYERELGRIREFTAMYQRFSDLEEEQYPTDAQQAEEASLRETLNHLNAEVAEAVQKGGVTTTMVYYAPVTRQRVDLDLFSNIFLLGDYQIEPVRLIDMLDRAVGNYLENRRRFRRRLLNPLHWVGEIIRLPFHLLSFAGFRTQRIEMSVLGKLYKFVASAAAFVWLIIQILDYFWVIGKTE